MELLYKLEWSFQLLTFSKIQMTAITGNVFSSRFFKQKNSTFREIICVFNIHLL